MPAAPLVSRRDSEPLRESAKRKPVERAYFALAAALWCGTLLFISLRIALGYNHFDSWFVYADAALDFAARRPLYTDGIDGFQYLPSAALVMLPWARLGAPVADIVWRATIWLLLAHAIWRSTCILSAADRPRRFLIATVLALGPSLSSLVTGQANLAIAGLMLQGANELALRRWWRAAAWLAVGFAVKPLAATMILLTCVLYPRMTWRLAITVCAVALAPFAWAPRAYVLDQYRAWLTKLALSAAPDRFFEDLRGLLHSVGIAAPHGVLRAVALAAAVGAVALCLQVRRRWPGRPASLLVFAVAGVYLMLFNPRTQPNSYVIIVPAAALAAALLVRLQRWRGAAGLIVIVICWSGTTSLTAFWLKPLACAIFASLLVAVILRDTIVPNDEVVAR